MSVNKDQVKGRAKSGSQDQVTGKLVGNESLEAKGGPKNSRQGQARFGDIKQDMTDSKKSA